MPIIRLLVSKWVAWYYNLILKSSLTGRWRNAVNQYSMYRLIYFTNNCDRRHWPLSKKFSN